MHPNDPGDGQGLPAPPARAMAHGSTIIRPGAVAWGGFRDTPVGAYPSCEAVEDALAAVARDPGQIGALLAELAGTRLWVPLPGRRPFTDGAAIRLPAIGCEGTDLVPCFTSVQRLTAWADEAAHAGRRPPGDPSGYGFADVGHRWQRAGDPRTVPHIVVPAAGLAQRLPPGTGLALNPGADSCVPLFPECVAFLARLPRPGTRQDAVPGAPVQVGEPPAEPVALLREVRAGLRALPAVRAAARAWLTVPGRGEGLVIAVFLDNPGWEPDRAAVTEALERAVSEVPLQVPFPVDVTFPGEGGTDLIDAWVARNAHPFYSRD